VKAKTGLLSDAASNTVAHLKLGWSYRAISGGQAGQVFAITTAPTTLGTDPIAFSAYTGTRWSWYDSNGNVTSPWTDLNPADNGTAQVVDPQLANPHGLDFHP